MELRKDPITRSWVIIDDRGAGSISQDPCPLCAGNEALSPLTISSHPLGHPEWQIRVTPHMRALYNIQGDSGKRAEGPYDRMRPVGAHEIVVETRDHFMPLSHQSDEHIAQVLDTYVARLSDLKNDTRFRYITVFRNQGKAAGQELDHPHSEITATPFIPRRVSYELQAAQRHFSATERCLFCDILSEELKHPLKRLVASEDQFAAFCPFAARVPYETWVMPVYHHSRFEVDLIRAGDNQLRLARFLKGVLQRLEFVSPSYHLVLHTSPNTKAKYERASNWRTLESDYHWHIEILPVISAKSKPYSLKEVYYNNLAPETAAAELRAAPLAPRTAVADMA
ncbi:MAG: hypothetical protein KGM47_14445 [Acidobacteriota bacterium]|nr:hypothetical protein [Acidobacteriota bacterium]